MRLIVAALAANFRLDDGDGEKAEALCGSCATDAEALLCWL